MTDNELLDAIKELRKIANTHMAGGTLFSASARLLLDALDELQAKCAKLEAFLAERERLVQELEFLWSRCKIVYWPSNDSYPVEHNPLAGKNGREMIESFIAREALKEK